MNISLIEIYIEFFLLGLQLLGGGYVIVPLMKKYLVDKKNWLSAEDLVNFYALSQSIPGIIAANISVFAGYKLKGILGAVVSLLGIITSPVISILFIAAILDKLLQLSFIQSIFWGVGIAVVILIYLSVKEMWGFAISDLMSRLIFLGAFILSFVFDFSPAVIILIAGLSGILFNFIAEWKKSDDNFD